MLCSYTYHYWVRFQWNLGKCIFIDIELQSKFKWYLINRTTLIILFLGELYQTLLSAVVSANTITTIDLNWLVQLNPILALALFIMWVEKFALHRKLEDVKYHIHSAILTPSVLSVSSLFHAYQNIINAQRFCYFHTASSGMFCSYTNRTLYFVGFFSTATFFLPGCLQ